MNEVDEVTYEYLRKYVVDRIEVDAGIRTEWLLGDSRTVRKYPTQSTLWEEKQWTW